jgi:hypothetical protein
LFLALILGKNNFSIFLGQVLLLEGCSPLQWHTLVYQPYIVYFHAVDHINNKMSQIVWDLHILTKKKKKDSPPILSNYILMYLNSRWVDFNNVLYCWLSIYSIIKLPAFVLLILLTVPIRFDNNLYGTGECMDTGSSP